MLSLSQFELPYIEIKNMTDLWEAYTWLTSSEEAKPFETVCLDSISEIAEIVLAAEKLKTPHGQKAYGEMQEQVTKMIRAFRDAPKHVYFSALVERSQDEMGTVTYQPALPGQKVGPKLPSFFDEALALRLERDAEGNTHRALMTNSDGSWVAKDRSGKLNPAWEPPDLGAIIRKIGGSNG